MANQWFRMYHEFATDPKVQMLSEADQRRYIMLLCLRCSNDDVTLQDEEVAFQLRISIDEWASTKATLRAKTLINADNTPTGWEKRQYASDSSAARVRKHRESKKQQCNVTETKCNALDTDTDTDREKDKSFSKRARKTPLDFSAWQSKPSDQVLADWMAMRKANKAPVSQTVIDQFGIQINLAVADGRTADECLSVCAVKAWRGFRYQWLKNEEASNAGNQRPVGQSRSDRNDQALREYFAHVDAEENSGHDLDGAVQPEAGDGAGGQFGAHAVRA